MEGHHRLIAKLKGMLKDLGLHDHLMSRSLYLGKKIPDWRHGSSGRNGSVRPRSQNIGARSELQGPRFG